MSLIQIDRNPSARQLAVFALSFLVAFALVGRLVLKWTGAPWAAGACWALAVVVPLAGALRPPVLRRVYVAVSAATAPIGAVVSVGVLAAVYCLALVPIALVLRWRGHRGLELAYDPRARTYWVERDVDPNPERHFRQF